VSKEDSGKHKTILRQHTDEKLLIQKLERVSECRV